MPMVPINPPIGRQNGDDVGVTVPQKLAKAFPGSRFEPVRYGSSSSS